MRLLITFIILIGLMSCHNIGNRHLEAISAERQITVDGTAYFIKGVCYHPVPVGQKTRDFIHLEEDLALMQEAGINTVRLYEPVDDDAVLDAINKAGIKAIISFGYNQKGVFDIKSGSFTSYIEKYKNHPAILMWEFGNEYNYHPEWFEDDITNWYTALNEAVLVAKRLDPLHPTATAHGELPEKHVLELCPDVDVWGMNVYRWDKPASIFREWEKLSDKPMYLSEAGADSYMTKERKDYAQGPNERAQANATHNILDDVFDHKDACSGVAVFSFVDEWWKAGDIHTQEPGGWAPDGSGVPYDGVPNEEYWGIVNIDRSKKEAFEVVKDFFLKH